MHIRGDGAPRAGKTAGPNPGADRTQTLRQHASFTKRLEEARRRRMLLLGDARQAGASDDELPFDLRARAPVVPDLIDEAEVARRHGPPPPAAAATRPLDTVSSPAPTPPAGKPAAGNESLTRGGQSKAVTADRKAEPTCEKLALQTPTAQGAGDVPSPETAQSQTPEVAPEMQVARRDETEWRNTEPTHHGGVAASRPPSSSGPVIAAPSDCAAGVVPRGPDVSRASEEPLTLPPAENDGSRQPPSLQSILVAELFEAVEPVSPEEPLAPPSLNAPAAATSDPPETLAATSRQAAPPASEHTAATDSAPVTSDANTAPGPLSDACLAEMVAANLTDAAPAAPGSALPSPLMLDHTARIVPETPAPPRAEPARPRALRQTLRLAATPRFKPAPERRVGFGALFARSVAAAGAAFVAMWWALTGTLPGATTDAVPLLSRASTTIEVTALAAPGLGVPSLAAPALVSGETTAPRAPSPPAGDVPPAPAVLPSVSVGTAAPRLAAASPAATLPVIGAPVALPPARVSVSAPTGRAPWEMSGVIDALNAAGFEAFAAGAVSFAISADHVRYYHTSDRAAATAVAASFGGAVRDFTGFSPKPAAGTLEVWLAGRALPEASPPAPTPQAPPTPAALPPTLADRMFGTARSAVPAGN